MAKHIILLAFFLFSSTLLAQLPDGATAPNWTLTDLDGETHTLYNVLNSGKHVILDFSASWCGFCWSYHNSGALEDIYHDYGPDGTDEVRVFFIEASSGTNDDCLYGMSSCTGGTQGNWVAGTDYPMFNLEGSDLNVASAYNINFFPTIYGIHAEDKTIWHVGQFTASEWETLFFESFILDASPNIIDGNCSGGGAIELNPSGGANDALSYAWSDGSTDEDAIDLETGIYSVTITDDLGYFISIEDMFVESDSDLEIISAFTEDISCFGEADGSIELTVASSSSVSYIWSNGMSGNFIEGLSQGIYDVIIVNNSNNCEITASYFVDTPDEIVFDGVAESASCGEENGLIEYSYDGAEEPITIFLNGVAVNDNPIINLPSGNYELELLDGNSCSVTTELVVNDVAAPILQIEETEVLSCLVLQSTLDASMSTGNNLAFTWMDDQGVLLGEEASVEVFEPGIYTCQITDAVSNCVVTETVEVLGDFEVTDVLINTPEPIACIGDVIQIEAEELSDVIVSWSTVDGNIVDGQDGFTPTVSEAGTYVLEVLNPANGCTEETTVEVEALGNSVNAQFNYTLDGNTVLLEDLSVGDGLSYIWDFGDGNTSTDNVTEYTYAEDGVYILCVEVENNCGVSNDCKTVFVGGAPSFEFVLMDISCFESSDGSITIDPTGGVPDFEIAWEGVNGFISNEFSIENLEAGEYTMVLTDATEAFVEQSFVIAEPSAISIENAIIVNDENGQGLGSIELTGTGGTGELDYIWEDGVEGPLRENLEAGEYTVEIRDENDCSNSFDFLIENVLTSSEDIEYWNGLEIFPSPAVDMLQVILPRENTEAMHIDVLSLEGKIILQKNYLSGNTQVQLDVSDLHTGMYLLRIATESKSIVRKIQIVD